MTTQINGTGNIGSTVLIGAQDDPAAFEFAGRVAITTAATLGTMSFTVTWTDSILGARSHTENLLLTALGNYKEFIFPAFNAPHADISYSVSVTGVLGTPAYTIEIGYIPVN